MFSIPLRVDNVILMSKLCKTPSGAEWDIVLQKLTVIPVIPKFGNGMKNYINTFGNVFLTLTMGNGLVI